MDKYTVLKGIYAILLSIVWFFFAFYVAYPSTMTRLLFNDGTDFSLLSLLTSEIKFFEKGHLTLIFLVIIDFVISLATSKKHTMQHVLFSIVIAIAIFMEFLLDYHPSLFPFCSILVCIVLLKILGLINIQENPNPIKPAHV